MPGHVLVMLDFVVPLSIEQQTAATQNWGRRTPVRECLPQVEQVSVIEDGWAGMLWARQAHFRACLPVQLSAGHDILVQDLVDTRTHTAFRRPSRCILHRMTCGCQFMDAHIQTLVTCAHARLMGVGGAAEAADSARGGHLRGRTGRCSQGCCQGAAAAASDCTACKAPTLLLLLQHVPSFARLSCLRVACQGGCCSRSMCRAGKEGEQSQGSSREAGCQ